MEQVAVAFFVVAFFSVVDVGLPGLGLGLRRQIKEARLFKMAFPVSMSIKDQYHSS